ncbi:MAG: tetratricopeptide repeat protein [Fibrobacterota bacterium]
MAQIKFSKQHKIKEDRFITTVINFRALLEAKKKSLLIGVVVVVAVAFVVLIAFKIKGRINNEARDTFSSALIDFQEGRYTNAISKFKAVADNYSGSSSAPKALYLLGSLYYDLGNYALSIESYKRYIDKFGGDGFVTPAVYKGLGSAYMQTRDFANAITAFESGIKKDPKDFSVPELRFKLARCYAEKQDKAAAREQYGLIVSEFPRSSYAREAELRLAGL